MKSKFSKIALMVGIATLAYSAPSQQTEALQHLPAKRRIVVGVGNFAEVTPKLFRGAQPKLDGYDNLKKMGVDVVVDLRLSGKDSERKKVTNAGMEYIALPWHCLFPKDEVFARFLTFVREHPDKKIFVHCRYGDDRTGMMIAAYRMAYQGWTWQESRQEMNKFGFHHSICASLVRYEKSFPERLQSSAAFESWRSAEPAR